MAKARYSIRTSLLAASALAGSLVLALSTPVAAQEKSYQLDLPSQPLSQALMAFGSSTDRQIVFSEGLVKGRTAPPLHGDYTASQALAMLLAGSGLTAQANADGVILVQKADDPQSGSAAGDGADQGTVQALIVTAQKREEQIQDVPIAISAFTQKELEAQKIEGGFDLLKAIPNVTFSKNNFSGYNFSIRGVGTKAVSATTDPGVAVAFNNTTLIQNRLFEQEYFDIERVEVLRGPQGTLYGRNATSGVINVITAKPKLSKFEGNVKFETGNYDARRVVGMINIPIINDVLAVRLAGSWTKRTGYDYNETTQHNVNGRDLWSGRLSIGFTPFERLRSNLVWEHFDENDDRSRTGKQLCQRDTSPTQIGSTLLPSDPSKPFDSILVPAAFSQGCQPGSLYDDAAFGTPNGLAIPFIFSTLWLQGDCGVGCTPVSWIGDNPVSRRPQGLFAKFADPYGGLDQSRDLRTIASVRDPIYRAKADVIDLNVDFDINDALTLTSQTVYNKDQVYSFQDYNRFNSAPVFSDTSILLWPSLTTPSRYVDLAPRPEGSPLGTPGVFCDPQIGCSDRVAGFDISQAVGKQFSQELRLQSDFDGPVNFSVGANYTKFKTVVDYYVMYNVITALAEATPFNQPVDGVIDPSICAYSGPYFPFLGVSNGPVPIDDPTADCVYIDPNPVESINGEGHNYFRSKNPYKLNSKAAFGEVYWNVNEALKLTVGLRYTDDEKTFIPVPSQVLLGQGVILGGTVNRGYPEDPPIIQKWGEWTGRLGFDWKPDVSFTDQSLIYAFYSHGYKGGGANPPTPGFATGEESAAYWIAQGGFDSVLFLPQPGPDGVRPPLLQLTGVEYDSTFKPEFVDAFEVGSKNTLLHGAMTFNATGFYYDYKDYQVSQIRDRTAVNENFDAKIWGLEFETVFAPSHNIRINANLGYLDTSIAEGESSIDIMNRTQGNPNYTLVKPWIQLPSNCVAPTAVVEKWLTDRATLGGLNVAAIQKFCGGVSGFNGGGPALIDPNPAFGGGTQPYDYRNYPEINGGAGLRADLGGNELPNAPHWTTNVGAEYGRDILDGSWRVTLRGDAYWQSQSWARVYNAVNDKLHGWYNVNVSVRVANEDLGIEGEFYVKNLLDKSPITDAFLNSDDTALTTNVFVLDPRLVGFNIRKTF